MIKKNDVVIPAIMVDDSSANDRLLVLEKLPPRQLEVDVLSKAIRPDCHGDWIEKAVRVWDAGAYDSAYLVFWNRALADLRTKLVAYGLGHLEAIVGKPIKDERDLVNVLDDKGLLDACFELGIISEQAWFFLNQAREVRNHYSLAHQFDADVDPIEAMNIIKNCVKYVLAHQVPSPGINLKEVLEKLRSEDITSNVKEFEATYKEQATKIVNITLNRLFDDLIEEKSNQIYMRNILSLAPYLWNLVDEVVKNRIGKQVARIRVEGDPIENQKAMAFIATVKGMKYVPESIRVAMFTSAADKLYDACEQANNFYREEDPAKELRSLGPEIPTSAANAYSKATALSYIGNQFGNSWAAGAFVLDTIKFWPGPCVDAFMKQLDDDLILIGRLSHSNPAGRLQSLLKILQGKVVEPATQKKLDFYSSLSIDEITSHFSDKLFKRFTK
ncbi:MAG: hypothetical protein MN733_29830 [Nitrososphaera sp.]|nr:hypothetical protein [Nitrososphaera sp.]